MQDTRDIQYSSNRRFSNLGVVTSIMASRHSKCGRYWQRLFTRTQRERLQNCCFWFISIDHIPSSYARIDFHPFTQWRYLISGPRACADWGKPRISLRKVKDELYVSYINTSIMIHVGVVGRIAE